MNFHNNRQLLLFVAFLIPSVGMPVNSIAQDWRDPALQQPVRQYFSGSRYPLNGSTAVTDAVPSTVLPKTNSPRVDEINMNDFEPMPKKVKKTPARSKPVAKDKQTKSKPAEKKTSSKAKKSDKKKSDKKTDKKKEKAEVHHPVKTWDVYRDRSPYPVDPRKPCSVCKREVGSCNCGCQTAGCEIGNQGMPWQETEPGGRSCGKKCCGDKRPEFSVYWPKPLSARRENRNGGCDGCGHTKCRCRKVNDLFDHLVNFRLIDYQRKDNGYCGPDADPYGCLGESRTQVAGVGFRFPSEPFTR